MAILLKIMSKESIKNVVSLTTVTLRTEFLFYLGDFTIHFSRKLEDQAKLQKAF